MLQKVNLPCANTHYDVTNFGVDFEYLENGA